MPVRQLGNRLFTSDQITPQISDTSAVCSLSVHQISERSQYTVVPDILRNPTLYIRKFPGPPDIPCSERPGLFSEFVG